MAVIDKKLIHFTNLATFEERLNAGDIKDTSIVFIQDAKRIWTHGLYYSSPYTKEEIDSLFVGSNVTLDGYPENGVAEIIATDTVNEAFGKVEDYLEELNNIYVKAIDVLGEVEDPDITYATKAELNNALYNKADKSAIPTNISDLVNDRDYITKTVADVTYQPSGDYKSEIKVVEPENTTFELQPNVYYKWGEVTTLDLTLAEPVDTTIYNEYMFEFVSGSTATTLIIPNNIIWELEPNIEADRTYQCSIVNNIGLMVGV